MIRIRLNVLIFFALVPLVMPPLHAADSSGGSINTPNNDAYTMAPVGVSDPNSPASSPKPKRHRKAKSSTQTSKGPIIPHPAATENSRPPAGAANIPGIADDAGASSVGGTHMGAQDHTPGTTGTSGQ